MTRGDVHYLTKMNIPSKWKPHFYSQSNCKIVVTFPNRYIPHYIRLRVKFNKQLVERNGEDTTIMVIMVTMVTMVTMVILWLLWLLYSSLYLTY